MPEGEIAALKALLANGRTGDAFAGVWPVNRKALDAFLVAATQWRTGIAMTEKGVLKTLWIGLDYAAAKVAMDAAGIALDAATLAGLRVMEIVARKELNS